MATSVNISNEVLSTLIKNIHPKNLDNFMTTLDWELLLPIRDSLGVARRKILRNVSEHQRNLRDAVSSSW